MVLRSRHLAADGGETLRAEILAIVDAARSEPISHPKTRTDEPFHRLLTRGQKMVRAAKGISGP